jgi:hypothetical protein
MNRLISWAATATAFAGMFVANASEPVRHPNGFVFPETIASFHRERVVRNDKEGKDISVTYGDRKAPAVITVSVYPAASPYSSSSLRKHQQDCVRQIATHAAPIQKVLESETKPRGSYRGFGGIYAYQERFAGRMQLVITWLEVYQSGSYIVKFEESYPDATADASAGAIGKFNDAFVWPK